MGVGDDGGLQANVRDGVPVIRRASSRAPFALVTITQSKSSASIGSSDSGSTASSGATTASKPCASNASASA
jgi:hypothetical protein